MISIRQTGKESISILRDIYNNANMQEAACNNKEALKLEEVLLSSNIYLFYENEVPAAFSACAVREMNMHIHMEITALYVKQEFEEMGYDMLLLRYMEDRQFGEEMVYYVSLTAGFPYSRHIFIANGYSELTKEQAEELGLSEILFDPDINNLYKVVKKEASGCCCQSKA